MIDILHRPKDLKIREIVRQVLNKKLACKRKSKQVLIKLFARCFLGLKQKPITLASNTNDREQTPLCIRKGREHLRSVVERLHVVRDHAVQKLSRFLSVDDDQSAFLFKKACPARTDLFIYIEVTLLHQ